MKLLKIVLLTDLVLRPMGISILPWTALLNRATLDVVWIIGTIILSRVAAAREQSKILMQMAWVLGRKRSAPPPGAQRSPMAAKVRAGRMVNRIEELNIMAKRQGVLSS